MSNRFTLANWRRAIAVGVVLLLGTTGVVVAQVQSGNLYGEIMDQEGNPLPGVTVTISGIGAPQVQVSNAEGQVRFLGLDPGNYDLTAELDGFSTVEYPEVNVRVGRNTTIEVQLSPGIEEVITVTAESPLLDERKLSKSTTVTQIELEKIPTSRDPWDVLNQTPGVNTDRVNVGGSESGQQSQFNNPGLNNSENVFAIDGVVITDMAAVGSSPTYYDFDQYTEFQISTGGTEITAATAGVTLNLVTKRGSNDARGSGRFMLTDPEDLWFLDGADPWDGEGSLGPGQDPVQLNTVTDVTDFGFEAGGAFIKDHFWGWGSWGRQQVNTLIRGAQPDDTLLENSAIKLNAQFTGSNSGLASFNRGDKIKDGRVTGPNRSLETAWDQEGPTEVFKLEDTHIFSSNFFLTASWAYVDGGFQLIPKSGFRDDGEEAVLGRDGIWRQSFYGGIDNRDSEDVTLDASYFFNTGGTSHELKFGTKLRSFDQDSVFAWSGQRQMYHLACENIGSCGAFGTGDYTAAQRVEFASNTEDYTSFWVQDTITMNRWTINLGLRYDQQEGENLPGTASANPVFPELLPDLVFPGGSGGFDFSDVTPRVGVTYAMGEDRDTLLRASFSQYASQLASAFIGRLNPVGLATVSFFYDDLNNDAIWEEGEPILYLGHNGADPEDPASAVNPNINDPNLEAELTSELLFGIEHAVVPEFVVGLDIAWRNTEEVHHLRPMIRQADGTVRPAVASDYYLERTITSADNVPLPDGSAWSTDIYALNEDLSRTGGQYLYNSDREHDYQGVSVSFTKRLSNRWFARGYFNYGNAEWKIPASFLALDDPTDDPGRLNISQANEGLIGEDTDGGVFAPQGVGSATDTNQNSTWSWNLNGLYQVAPDKPWGFNIAANLFGREGYPVPYFVVVQGPDGISREAAVQTDPDKYRMDNVFITNLRIEWEFPASEDFGLTFSIDCFNCTSEQTELQREPQLNFGQADFLERAMAPRIYRLGMRLAWK